MTEQAPARSTLAASAMVSALLAVVAGATWALVTPAVSGRITPEGAAVAPQQFGEEFAGVGVFALIMFGYGALAAGICWATARTWRGPVGYAVTLGAVAVGTPIAGVAGTWIAGWRFGDIATQPMGATFRVVPDLWLDGATRDGFSAPWALLLCAPVTATLVYLACALAAGPADLGADEADRDSADRGPVVTSAV